MDATKFQQLLKKDITYKESISQTLNAMSDNTLAMEAEVQNMSEQWHNKASQFLDIFVGQADQNAAMAASEAKVRALKCVTNGESELIRFTANYEVRRLEFNANLVKIHDILNVDVSGKGLKKGILDSVKVRTSDLASIKLKFALVGPALDKNVCLEDEKQFIFLF